jgi:hypothetical protein
MQSLVTNDMKPQTMTLQHSPRRYGFPRYGNLYSNFYTLWTILFHGMEKVGRATARAKRGCYDYQEPVPNDGQKGWRTMRCWVRPTSCRIAMDFPRYNRLLYCPWVGPRTPTFDLRSTRFAFSFSAALRTDSGWFPLSKCAKSSGRNIAQVLSR